MLTRRDFLQLGAATAALAAGAAGFSRAIAQQRLTQDDLLRFEPLGQVTLLHFTDKRQILVCRTLREVEQMLPEKGFARIHRSHTIHLRHIKKYVRGKGGHVVMQNGATLVVSAGQKDLFLGALRQYFG